MKHASRQYPEKVLAHLFHPFHPYITTSQPTQPSIPSLSFSSTNATTMFGGRESFPPFFLSLPPVSPNLRIVANDKQQPPKHPRPTRSSALRRRRRIRLSRGFWWGVWCCICVSESDLIIRLPRPPSRPASSIRASHLHENPSVKPHPSTHLHPRFAFACLCP